MMAIDLTRTHDFQLRLSPTRELPASINPPSFNWPENAGAGPYVLELENQTTSEAWRWDGARSPFQLSFLLPAGQYRWRLLRAQTDSADQASEWVAFEIDAELAHYLAPTPTDVFSQCNGRDQWLMYFDEDILAIREKSRDAYSRLKRTTQMADPISAMAYPDHYLRGHEEGKRKAIGNVRRWIDRDLVANALLFRIWGERSHGEEAMHRLLKLAEWSPEGPASLLRPCTWGDEVGLSLARNLFLVYHWVTPLLNDSEKAFIRPMLVRIARQMRERLEQDEFEQYPGHSHTSRLPGYLGVAALALYREHDRQECEAWLTYSLMIYRGVLPFYGGADGSWAEGSFYASSYSKWFHPFFLSIERVSGFSFYQHPFYKNFHKFARDMISPDQTIHPFGDGFWCKRDGKEWPGFFSQNPLRIYADRFGDAEDVQDSLVFENDISVYHLHLLDVVPTVQQLAHVVSPKWPRQEKAVEQGVLNRYYGHGGFGKLLQKDLGLYYRASAFGNSSHRHGDQGNIAFFDNGMDVLAPTGSYGYRFGSKHHSNWTRQTIAHNLPLVDGLGQMLDDHRAIGRLIDRQSESTYQQVTLELSESYPEALTRYFRTLILLEGCGLIVMDSISLARSNTVQWRLHSHLDASMDPANNGVLLNFEEPGANPYCCQLVSHLALRPTISTGYVDDLTVPAQEVASDARKRVSHLEWLLPEASSHCVIACCFKKGREMPMIRHAVDARTGTSIVTLKVQQQVITVPTGSV